MALTISTYDGNVEKSVTEDTTHIIVKDDMSHKQKEVICLVIESVTAFVESVTAFQFVHCQNR